MSIVCYCRQHFTVIRASFFPIVFFYRLKFPWINQHSTGREGLQTNQKL